jgi:hypothetical protein
LVVESKQKIFMPAANPRITHKHFRLDTVKLKHAQKALSAATETETVERALQFVINEDQRNRATADANRAFLKSGIAIKDVFGALDA